MCALMQSGSYAVSSPLQYQVRNSNSVFKNKKETELLTFLVYCGLRRGLRTRTSMLAK